MDQNDYHFYDMDEKHTEGQGLMDDEFNHELDHDHGSATAPNYLCGLVAGGLAVLLLIVSLVLAWILHSRHKGSSINLTHAIISTLAFLFAGLAAFVAFTLWKKGKTGIANNANIAFVVYVGAIFLAIYFIVFALVLWVHKLFFSHTVQCSNSIPADWNDNFWGKNYDSAQFLFWRYHLILAVFALVIAVCFAILASSAWHLLTNKVQAKKITLGIGLIGVVVWGFLVIIWFADHKATYAYIQSKLHAKFAFLPFIVFLLAIIALGLAFLNSVLNFIKAKTLNFIFAAFWIGLFFVLAIFVGLLFRNAYHMSEQRTFDRQEVASFVPELHYKEFCGDKYLKVNQVCGSAYSASTWDRSPVAQGWLNPKCDCSSTDLMLWPWFVLSIFAAFLLASIAIVIVSNFALASSEHDEDAYGAFHIFDVITLGIIVLLAIALGFWLGFRPNPVNNAYQHSKSGLYTSFKGALLPNASFGQIPSALSQRIQLKDQCYFLGKAVLPQFKASNSTNAGYSVGVLVTNGRINSNYIGKDAQVGAKISRQYFFSNANNDKDDFVNLYGKYDDVTDALRNLVVCQSSLQVNHGVYVHAIAIDISKVSSNGLTNGVAPTYTEPFPNGSSPDLNGYATPAGACAASCTFSLVNPVTTYLHIRGVLTVKDVNGLPTTYGVPEANLVLTLYQNQHGREVNIALGSYDANGNFLIQAPYIQNAAYKAVLHIDDKSNQYLSNKIDIIVSPPNGNSDLSVGNVYLTTRSGKGCKQPDLPATWNCFNNQQSASALLTLNIQDVVSPGATLNYPLTLTVRQTGSELGPVVHTETVNGPTWSKTLPVGYYHIQVAGNNYSNNIQAVTLDGPQTVTSFLEEKLTGGYRIYAAIDNSLEPNVDYDLNLKIRAADGSECVVNPINRICPYATHIQSISQGQKGFEVIEVPQFTNAYYMVYVTKNQVPVGNCPYTNTTALRFLSQSPKDSHMADFLTNSAVRVFTSSFGGSSPFGNEGASSSSSYTARSDTTFNPINYGGSPVIPNLLSALASHNTNVPADQLFKEYVRDSDDAVLFGNSMPILYNPSVIDSQTRLISNNNNFPSKITSIFQKNINNGKGDQSDSQNLVTAYVYNTIKTANANTNELIRESNNLTPTSQFYPEQGFDNIVNFMVPYGSFDDTVKQHVELINSNQYNYNANVAANSPVSGQSDVVVLGNNTSTEVVVQENTTPVVVETTTETNSNDVVVVPVVSSAVQAAADKQAEEVAEAEALKELNAEAEESVQKEAEAEALAALAAAEEAQKAANQNEVFVANPTDIPVYPTSNQVNSVTVDESQSAEVIPLGNITTTTTTTDIDTNVTPNGDIPVQVNTLITTDNSFGNIPVQVIEAAFVDSKTPVKYQDATYTKTINLGANGEYPLDTSLLGLTTSTQNVVTETTQTTSQEVLVNPDGSSTYVNKTPVQTTTVETYNNGIDSSSVVPVVASVAAAETLNDFNAYNNKDVIVTGEPNPEDLALSNEIIANATELNHSDDLPVTDVTNINSSNEVVVVPAEELTPVQTVTEVVTTEPVIETEVLQVAPVVETRVIESPPVVVDEPVEVIQPVEVVPVPAEVVTETIVVEETPVVPIAPIETNSTEMVTVTTTNDQPVQPVIVETNFVNTELPTTNATGNFHEDIIVANAGAPVIEEPVTTSTETTTTTTTSQNNEAPTTVTTTTHDDGSASTTVDNNNAEVSTTTTTTSNEAEVIPDRRLKDGRKLQAVQQTYITQFCFTGFGEQSIKPFASSGAGSPSIQPCLDLYPDSDSYSLASLKQATN